MAEQILLSLKLDIEQTKVALQQTKDGIALYKAELKTLNDQLKVVEAQQGKESEAFKTANIAIIDKTTQLKAAQKEQNQYQLALTKSVQAQNADAGSLNEMRAALSAITSIYAAKSDAEKTSNASVIQMSKDISALSEQLKLEERALGDNRREVGNYENATKSLKIQLREATVAAQEIAQKFGANSDAAIKAAKTVADLREEINDFNKRVDALNPEAKFQAFAQVAAGLAGGFQAAQGAITLFGGESEAVGQALVKLQAAMAFAQGLKQFAELGDSIKNVRAVLGLSTFETQKNTAATAENNVAKEEAVVVNEGMAVAEGEAAVATTGLSVAMKTLLLTSGLILLPLAVEAVTAAFKAFTAAKINVDDLIGSIERENAAHKLTVEQLKAKNEATITEAGNALSLAKAKGESEAGLASLQKDLITKRLDGLRKEGEENNTHLSELERRQLTYSDKVIDQMSKSDREKAVAQKKATEEEIQQTVLKNQQLLNEYKKLQTDIAVVNAEAEQKETERVNRVATLRITLIKNDRAREIAAERESASEKLQVLLRDEAANVKEIGLVRQQEAQKVKEINLKFDLQEARERSQLSINASREGTVARLEAQIKGAETERELLLRNDKLTANQREIIAQESANKIRAFEESKLKLVEDINQQEVDLENRKQQALAQAQEATAGNDVEAKFIARLNVINTTTEAELQAKEKAADAEKLIAQQQITDADAFAARIKEIDETTAAEKLAIVTKSAQDIKTATEQTEAERIQTILAQKQLEVDASGIFEKAGAEAAVLAVQEQQEIASAQKRLGNTDKFRAQKELIEKKYDNLRLKTQEANDAAALASVSNTLSTAATLFKKGSSEYKVLATASALIDTYASANAAFKAVAGIPVVGPALGAAAAAVAIAAGLANVAKINSTDATGGVTGKYEGGFTGHGDPRQESLAVGGRPYKYHKEEYVVPHQVLQSPAGAALVNSLESMRTGRTSATHSFAEGGVTPSYAFISQEVGQSVADRFDLENTLITAMRLMPAPRVAVEDINTVQTQVEVTSNRANI